MNSVTLTALYLTAIIAANLSVATFGPPSVLWNAFVFIGLNLVARDRLHDLWGRNVTRNMGLLILTGGAFSYAFNAGAGRIALASVLAFMVSETADALTYTRLRRRPFLFRSNASNLVGAAFDSLLFIPLAFHSFPVWIILGQFCAKAAGGYVWSRVLAHRSSAEAARL